MSYLFGVYNVTILRHILNFKIIVLLFDKKFVDKLLKNNKLNLLFISFHIIVLVVNTFKFMIKLN